ncbi:MAG: collagen-like protein [Bacteroidetes bacterium]|nr:collagen-like protein [Bacteroidota bacterium]
MLTKRLLIAGLLLLTFTAFFTACKKGDTGPAGAQGPAGPQGPKGDTGVANAIWSSWAYAGTIKDSVIDNSNVSIAPLLAPALTSARIANSTILVYFTYGSGYLLLPYTSYAGNKPNTMGFVTLPGKFIITRFTHDNSNAVKLSSILQYRYVIIPGGTPAPTSYDYNTVTRYYHAPPEQPIY